MKPQNWDKAKLSDLDDDGIRKTLPLFVVFADNSTQRLGMATV